MDLDDILGGLDDALEDLIGDVEYPASDIFDNLDDAFDDLGDAASSIFDNVSLPNFTDIGSLFNFTDIGSLTNFTGFDSLFNFTGLFGGDGTGTNVSNLIEAAQKCNVSEIEKWAPLGEACGKAVEESSTICPEECKTFVAVRYIRCEKLRSIVKFILMQIIAGNWY